MMKIFAFKEEELKEKTQDANFSLPNKNPESAIKNGFRIRIRIPKLAKNWADSGFRIRIPDTDSHPYWKYFSSFSPSLLEKSRRQKKNNGRLR